MEPKTSPQKQENGWFEWSRWVLKNIERLNETVENLPTMKEVDMNRHALEKLKIELDCLKQAVAITQTELKLKAGFWGIIGASIPLLIMILLKYLTP